LSKQIFDHELTAYSQQFDGILTQKQKNEFIAKMTPPEVIGTDVVISSCRAQLWSDIVEAYRKSYKNNRQTVKRTFGPLRIIFCDGFLLLKHDDIERWQLLTFEQLQMIQDCCLGRHNIQLAIQFGFHNGSENLKSHVEDVISWQESVLKAIGNDGFELVKAPEAIFKARLNSLTGGDLLKYTSYERTLDKIREKEIKLHGTTRLTDSFNTIVSRVTNLHDAAELFGLSKISGHPSVYAKKSAESVKKEALPKGTISSFAVRQLVRMFKHLTLSGYISEHSSWPPLRCPPAHNTVLRRHYVNRVTTLPLGSYPISDLDAIEFDKFVNYDYSEDYLKFLDDKAICPGAAEMSRFWFSGSRTESRRLLQKILSVEKFDTVAMVERLRRGKFKKDEYVIELTQKERELKTAARCFCKLPFEVRTFFTSTEYNLKESFMSKYMPQQTMTMSSTETKQRLYNLVKNAKRKDRTLLEVDFSRWNLRWREETVHGIARILEDIFGLSGVFTQAHPFFYRATVVLTDKHTLPLGARPDKPVTEWPESELVWRNSHRGGFEGIQQALWSICTIAMMYWVMHDQNLAFNMAGQGDNQIFAISFDTSIVPADVQLRQLLAVMEVRCSLLNHEVKPDECIDSSTVLTYSKDIYVEGNHVLYNLKFASRTFKRDEIDIPSLSSEIASISACSMACADSVYETPKAIFWKTFHTLRLISQRFRSPNYMTERYMLARLLSDPDFVTFALLIPGSLGGLPSMSWTRFFMKGEVDDVSWDVPAVRSLSATIRTIGWDLKLLLQGRHTPKRPELTQLILDPHSIPIRRPKDMKKLIKEAIAEMLPGQTKNKWIYEIITEGSDAEGKKLIDSLTSTVPFYPQIMSDVYCLSPSGVKDALISRFTMTRTISAITGNPNFATEIENANSALLAFLLQRYEEAKLKRGLPQLPNTSYETCKQLRSLWGSKVEHKNIGVYNPFDFPLTFTNTAQPMISASARTDSGTSLHDSLGVYPPNFGTKTRQKVSDHGFKIVTSSSTLADLKKLVLACSELGSSESWVELLSTITRARSPWSIDQLLSVLPTAFGGAAAHRHAAINNSAFSILGSRTVPTHLNFCSDLAGKLSGGEYDYPIAFQEFYLVLSNIFQVLTKCGVVSTNASIGFLMSDDYEELPTDVVIVHKPTDPKWKIRTDNKLCYVSELQMKEIPVIPQSTQIAHVPVQNTRVDSLIMSKLLHQYAAKGKLFRSTAAVNLPIELLDMKEFSHCPLSDLVRGTCWFIQVMAIHTCVSEFTKSGAPFLHQFVMALARSCASILARTLIHPTFYDTVFAMENGVACVPGVSGARNSADALAGELYESTLLSIRARDMLLHNATLILFADYSFSGALCAEMMSVSLIALQSRDVSTILVTNYQWLTIRSARYTILSDRTTLNTVLNMRSAVDTLAINRPWLDHVGGRARLRLVYVNATANEAIRSLRSLPLQTRLKLTKSEMPHMSFNTNHGRCTITWEKSDGSISPLHACQRTADIERTVDSFVGGLVRPIGLYSSARSIWAPMMSRVRRMISGRCLMSIGVGHGAVASIGLEMGALRVEGIDLRSSFPGIIQREGTYKPPEVILSGRSEDFSWSTFLSETGGDVIKHASKLMYLTHVDVFVVDVELPIQDVIKVLRGIPANKCLIVRAICCAQWARYIVDAVNADEVFNTTINRNSHMQSYVIIARKFQGYNNKANYKRIEFTSTMPWRSSVTKSMSHALTFANAWLRPYGEQVKILSAPELDIVAAKLLKRSLNCSDMTFANALKQASNDIDWVTTSFRDPDSISHTGIQQASVKARRTLTIWLANTVIPTDIFLNDLTTRLRLS